MVFDWLSDNRAIVAAIIILLLFGAFLWSVIFGIRQTRLREKDQVFGDPERTVGGWFWAVCGVSVLLLTWFYFSWGAARAFSRRRQMNYAKLASCMKLYRRLHLHWPSSRDIQNQRHCSFAIQNS